MAIEHFKGNRSPSLTATIEINDVVFDLTGSSVKLKMRPVNSSTLKVNTTAVIVAPTLGTVRYDWAAIDVDTAGDFIAWWEVTLPSAKVQDSPEFIISIRDHATAQTTDYLEREDLKRTLSLEGMAVADNDIDLAISAASRAVDQITGRRFWPDADVNQTRYFTARSFDYVDVGDLITLTSLTFDWDGDNVYELNWTALPALWMLDPPNALADGFPYQAIRTRKASSNIMWDEWDGAYGGSSFPTSEAAVKVVGRFGWLTAPPQIEEATGLIASRLLKRKREAPFGVASLGVDGVGVRIVREDPDVEMLLRPFIRAPLVA